MSVIVLGAELPKGYDDCWYLQCNLWKDCYLNGIRDNCPLRPLPEKHGRLIDGDALEFGYWVLGLGEKAIRTAQTIVEAEGE